MERGDIGFYTLGGGGGHHLRQQELLNNSTSSEQAISRLYLEMVLLSLSFLSLNIINAFSPTDVNNLALESRTQNYILCVCFCWRTFEAAQEFIFQWNVTTINVCKL